MENPAYTRTGAERRALLHYLPSWIPKTPSFLVGLKPQHDRYGPNQHQADSSAKASSICALVKDSSWNSLEHWLAPDWNSSTTSRDSTPLLHAKASFSNRAQDSNCFPTEQPGKPFPHHGSLTMRRKVRSQFHLPLPEGIRALSGSNPCEGCCRNKYTVITVGITALWMPCALSELHKTWRDRHHSSLLAKPSCSC